MSFVWAGIAIIAVSAATLRLVLKQARGFGMVEISRTEAASVAEGVLYVTSRVGTDRQWSTIVIFASFALTGAAAGGGIVCYGMIGG